MQWQQVPIKLMSNTNGFDLWGKQLNKKPNVDYTSNRNRNLTLGNSSRDSRLNMDKLNASAQNFRKSERKMEPIFKGFDSQQLDIN